MSAGRISMVVPTYNVARYLPAFLQSLDEQVDGLADVELIFVNDGATDDSGEIISAWLALHPGLDAHLLTQENGGLSSARNAGLAAATGEWITFPDPDDVLTPEYLSVMRTFLKTDKAKSIHLVAGNLIYLDDETGKRSNGHPLRFKFAEHHRIVDLERHPEFIHLHANTALFRRALIVKYGLRFDSRVKPNFEDAQLIGFYLAKFERPRIAMLDDAVYLYRRRSDGSSLVQSSWAKEAKYKDVPQYGWLHMLQQVHAERGRVPRWMQILVVYDMFFYFRMDTRRDVRHRGPARGVERDVPVHADRGPDVRRRRPDRVLQDRPGRARGPARGAVRAEAHRPADLRDVRRLPRPGPPTRPRSGTTTRARFRDEQYRARGFLVRPVFAKSRAVTLFGRVMMHERTAWLPATGTLSLTLNGRPTPLALAPPELPRYSVGPTTLWNELAGGVKPPLPVSASLKRRVRRKAGDARRTVRKYKAKYGGLERSLSKSPHAVLRYRKAWLLVDRDSQAQDNAEHLYRYLRAEQPQVNAWFVLAPSSSDWDRLRDEGFRLLEHGSREHHLALFNCEHVISSQVDHYIVRPLPKRYGEPTWRYTFLQHGVTKDDLSRWLNAKSIDLMITVTPDEHESIVADGTPYMLSDKEVKLTGFPRHDRLYHLAEAARARCEPFRARHADVAAGAAARPADRRQRPRPARRLLGDELRRPMAQGARVRAPAEGRGRIRLAGRVRPAPEHAGLP